MTPEDQESSWAWVILFAVTLWNFVLGGTVKIYGMLYVEFLPMLRSSPARVGLIGLVTGIMSILIGPGAGRLSDRHPSRILPLCGAVMATLAIALTGQTTSLLGAVFTYGVLFGISLGLSDGPVLSMLGKYFTKRRNFAYGVAFAGSSVGHVALAQLIAISIDYYTIRGAMLVLAGVWAQTCVLAMLLRPKKFPSKDRIKRPACDTKPEDSDAKINRDASDPCALDEYINNYCDNDDIHLKELVKENGTNLGDVSPKDSEHLETIAVLNIRNENKSKESVFISDKTNETIVCDSRQEIRDPLCERNHNPSPGDVRYSPNTSPREETDSDCCVGSCCPVSHKCSTLVARARARAARSSYLSFIRQEALWSALLLLACGMFGYYSLIIAMPAYLEELGLDRRHTAWFMFALGLSEVLSRLLITCLVDHFQLSAAIVLCSSMLVSGLSCLFVVIRPSYTLIVAYGAVHGALGGLSMVLMSSLMVECAGVENLGSSMGLAVMLLNITSTLTSLTTGAVYELTGFYANSIRLSGIVYLFGCTVYGLRSLIFRKYRSRRREAAVCRVDIGLSPDLS